MTRELVVEPAASPSGQWPQSPAPAFLILAMVTLVLLVLRNSLSTRDRRSLVTPNSDDSLGHESQPLPGEEVDRLEATQPVAVFLVGGDHALGPASLRILGNLYSKEYLQILFVSVGVMDYAAMDAGAEGQGNFKGTVEAKRLKMKTRLALDRYLAIAHQQGFRADCRVSVATDAVDEIEALSGEIAAVYPRAVFFVSKRVFPEATWFHSLLHSRSSDAIRTRLEKKGLPITVLPFVVPL
ncbi:MAG TPA: hypothetical protein VMU54_14075 [Planctomycetota bacterium]|nr:hypothetical protein [Planctomycetota bacterium]